MKQKLKSKISILIIFIVTFIVLFFALKDDFNIIVHQILTIDIKFLILSFLLILICFFLRAIVLNDIIIKLKKNYRFIDAFKLTLETQFFNGLTPFSFGGQT